MDKGSGRYRVVKTVGRAQKEDDITRLVDEGKQLIPELKGQTTLDFVLGDDLHFLETVRQSIERLQLLGQELILGNIFERQRF